MSELKVSVSGIRGIWADSLNLNNILQYTKAFGLFIKKNGGKKILLGRDARPTGAMIALYTASILNAMGFDVADAGIVPTPTVLFGVRNEKFDGGIVITASHNPIEWNALKFVKSGGVFTGEKDVEEIKSYLNHDSLETSYNKIGKYYTDNNIEKKHIHAVMNFINGDIIKKKKYKVVLDPVNSAGSNITRDLLAKLGCEVVVVHGEINGKFERETEPTQKNLVHLKEIVVKNEADVGFAQDPDADRLVVIDEKGDVLSEEMTLALAVENVLSHQKGDVVINMSTSGIIENISGKHGVHCYRTKVGEANVVEGIDKYKALIGGEGNGGVIYPVINKARDSLAGIGLILELMAERGEKLSTIILGMPKFTMVKEKFEFKGNLTELLNNLKKEFKNAVINEMDGLRLDWKEDGKTVWVHVRASNTEPVIRVIGEAENEEHLKNAFGRIKKYL